MPIAVGFVLVCFLVGLAVIAGGVLLLASVLWDFAWECYSIREWNRIQEESDK